MRPRLLSPDEAALWARVMAEVRPIAGRRAPPAVVAVPHPGTVALTVGETARRPVAPVRVAVVPVAAVRVPPTRPDATAPRAPSNTLDGSWDRQLSRGLVSPDWTIDLHGHTLHSAYDMLDGSLDAAIRRGDRVVLLVTGKPPRPTSERPHARGAIRAATGDWLAGSRHCGAIAAVRGAHPRHGGAGALYIVLKRPRAAPVPALPSTPTFPRKF